MKSIFIFLFSLAFATAVQGQTFNLTVNLEDLDSEKGAVKVCLMNDKKQYLKDCYVGKDFQFAAGKARRVVFADLPPGDYAIMAFHDEDGNGRLNTDGAFGLPSEPYAFSNNPNTWFGLPKHRKCVFRVDGDRVISLEF